MSARARTAAPKVDPTSVVSQLVDIGNTDTVYRDVYLERARTFLGEVISPEDFGRIERQQADLASLPLTIARALQRENWAQVQELTARMPRLDEELTHGSGVAAEGGAEAFGVLLRADTGTAHVAPGWSQPERGIMLASDCATGEWQDDGEA